MIAEDAWLVAKTEREAVTLDTMWLLHESAVALVRRMAAVTTTASRGGA